jgi:hypothetical protein
MLARAAGTLSFPTNFTPEEVTRQLGKQRSMLASRGRNA